MREIIVLMCAAAMLAVALFLIGIVPLLLHINLLTWLIIWCVILGSVVLAYATIKIDKYINSL